MAREHVVSRRTLLRGSVLTAGTLLAAGCGAHPASGTAAGPVANQGPAPPPTHVAPPDLPWTNHNIPPTYLKFPKPFTSVHRVPGEKGPLRHISWFSDEFDPPPAPLSSNRYWQGLNQRLGVTIDPIWGAAGTTFDEKFATLIASGSLPELVLYSGGATQSQAVQQGAFTDLTDYLTGSALKYYPNLALIPPKIWENSRINGRLYGVPRPRVVEGAVLVFRKDWASAVGIPTSEITDTQTFAKVLTDFSDSDPDRNGKRDTWGLGDIQYTYSFFLYSFRAPNNWRLNKDGSLTKDIETEEFKAAIAYARDLYKRGVFYPDAPSLTVAEHYTVFESSKTGAYLDAPYACGQTRPFLQKLGLKDPIGLLTPPGHAGQKPVMFNASGYNGIIMIPSKTGRSSAAVEELLRIIDYFCAPFGSDEYRYLGYGVEGVDHVVLPDGSLEQTAQARTDIGDLGRLMTPPMVIFNGPLLGFTDAQQAAWSRVMNAGYHTGLELGIDDPTLGHFSATNLSKGPTLTTNMTDAIISLVDGNTPFSQYGEMVSSWRQGGGDQIRTEFESAIHRHHA